MTLPTLVPFTEVHKSGTESLTDGRWSAERTFKIRWADRFAFANDVMGGIIQGAWTPTPTRRSPAQHPWIPTPCFAKTFRVQPIGKSYDAGDTKTVGFTDCLVTIGYQTPEGADEDQPEELTYVEENLDISAQMVSIPKGTYTFPDGTILDENFGKQMGSAVWSLKINEWGSFDVATIIDAMGMVNSSEFKGFPTGKLLFTSAGASRRFTSNGITAWDVDLKFAYRTKKWNEFVNPKTGDWELLDPLPYESTSFASILPF